MTTRILLVDDHSVIREGLRALLQKQSDMEVIEEVQGSIAAVRLSEKLRPDVVIMDIGMPDLNYIETTCRMASRVKGVKIIAVSICSEKRFVVEMLKAGAIGYLLKDCALEDLVKAVRAVRAGHVYLSQRVTSILVNDYLRNPVINNSTDCSLLTAREREVFRLLAEGDTTKEIASSLHVSTKTAEAHLRRIMKKLGVGSIVELTKYATTDWPISPSR